MATRTQTKIIVGRRVNRNTPPLTIAGGKISETFVRSPKTKRPPSCEKSSSLLMTLPSHAKML
jgi:hypothetical protein